jgi:surface protein
MLPLTKVLQSSKAAIDLASIMVGVIIIGLIGGIISATVFAVIPWSQDKAAKQQLESIHTAENAFYGFSADASTVLKNKANSTRELRNTFADSAELASNSLLTSNPTYCVVPTTDGKDYHAYSKSASGTTFYALNSNKQAQVFTGTFPCIIDTATGVVGVDPAVDNGTSPVGVTPGSTGGSGGGTTTPGTGSGGTGGSTTPTAPVNPLALTINCPTNINSYKTPTIDFVGKALLSDGTEKNYSSPSNPTFDVVPGKTYTIQMTGTYSQMSSIGVSSAPCLVSVDSWGDTSKFNNIGNGFYGSTNLVSVPDTLPPLITDLGATFFGASKFNSPNVSKWDTSRVTKMNKTFQEATVFNQDLSGWNTSKVTDMVAMFWYAYAFNQNISGWNTSNVTDMYAMFYRVTAFNQDISGWNTANVTRMTSMFDGAKAFKQNLSGWNVAKVTGYSSFNANGLLVAAELPKFK